MQVLAISHQREAEVIDADALRSIGDQPRAEDPARIGVDPER